MNENLKDEKAKKVIRELYNQMFSTLKNMEADFYVMSNEQYNSIMKKIAYLERALKEAKKRQKYSKDDLKKCQDKLSGVKNG